MKLQRIRLAALALALSAAPAAADVFIWGQPGSYASLQAAIDAAVDGDVLLLEPTTTLPYTSAVIDGKGLHLAGLGTGPLSLVFIRGMLKVQNLPATSSFSLSDIDIGWGFQTTPQSGLVDALWLKDCAGEVRVQRAYLRGSIYTSGSFNIQRGAGLRVESSPRVAVSGSELYGGTWKFWSGLAPQAGGEGVRSVDSSIALYDCTVSGGGGSQESSPTGGKGGAGVRVTGWGLYASGCSIRGGGGGGGDYIGCTFGGDGGTGLVATDAQVQVLESTLAGGPAATFGICGPGSPGVPTELSNATLIQHPGQARSLAGPASIDDKQHLTVSVEGDPGDLVWILRGRAPAFQPLPSALGIVLVPKPWQLPLAPMGVVPASGTLDVALWTSDLVGPQVGVVLYLQALIVGAGGEVRLSGPLHVRVRNT
jgi:hypothetical protein